MAEIRTFLGTDRVMVYRFHRNGSGKVIAESIHGNRLPSLLGLNFPADDIPPRARQQFVKTRLCSIVNVSQQQIGVSQLDHLEAGQPLTPPEIQYRPADPCHIQYLKTMGVEFSLVVPLLHEEKLWGLLVSHHSEPCLVSEAHLQFVQQVATQVSVAIAQSMLLNFARSQVQRETSVNRVTTLLHAEPNLPLQVALVETVAALQGCGGRLALVDEAGSFTTLFSCGIQPIFAASEGNNPLEEHLLSLLDQFTDLKGEKNKPGTPWVISEFTQEPHLEAFVPTFHAVGIQSLIIVPLCYYQQFLGYLIVFSEAVNTEIWWAGEFDSSQQQLQPRPSFEAWRELKAGQPRQWSGEEVELIQALGHHFSMAIYQYQLYQKVQGLNTDLEDQVKQRTEELEQRTEELQQSLELARVQKEVTNQIRRTLDLPTILQTIVQEVRKILGTDRVVVYHFLHTWEGQVVVEAVTHPELSILGQIFDQTCFPLEYTYQYQGGRIRAIDNILEAGLSLCHIEFLQRINVQANLIVPIRQNDYLWGLLIAHSCLSPRTWQPWELEILQQLADQASIAIYQAELYKKSLSAATTATEKARQLESALGELQRTQLQLIQTEKMSSLGQLVAGMAHEINNPVNFISANLTYANEYIQDLLKLLKLYQEDYPNPTARIQQQIEETDLDYVTEDLLKTLSSMKVGSDRIRQLVLSLRNFSRLDEAERKFANIHDGLDNTVLILQHRLNELTNVPAIQVIKKYGHLPEVECYVSQLNQVFLNIISNAIDALQQRDVQRTLEEIQKLPSQILISTDVVKHEISEALSTSRSLPDWAVIRIADNGPGISETIKPQIFNPFFTTKPVGKGTGLGLSICYQIMEKHGGKIDVNSTPGQSTEFVLMLPLHP